MFGGYEKESIPSAPPKKQRREPTLREIAASTRARAEEFVHDRPTYVEMLRIAAELDRTAVMNDFMLHFAAKRFC